jgi:hypothetical protein
MKKNDMVCQVFEKEYRRQFIAYFSLFCVVISSILPSDLFADANIIVDENDEGRTRSAYVIAGLTAMGLAAAGIAYATSSSHCRHSSRCSSSYYSYTNYPPDLTFSYGNLHCPRSKYLFHPTNSDDCSSSSSHDCHSSSCSRLKTTARNFKDIPPKHLAPQFLASHQNSIHSQNSSKSKNRLSGLFIPNLSATGQGSITAFALLPDGTNQILGRISLSGNGAFPLSFGPFYQEGTYTFGISVEEGTIPPNETKICSVNIEINGMIVQSHEFTLPPFAPAKYEPQPCYAHLK